MQNPLPAEAKRYMGIPRYWEFRILDMLWVPVCATFCP